MSDKTLFNGALIQNESMFSRMRAGFVSLMEPSTGAGAVPGDSPVHFDMIREESIFVRLADQFGFALNELQRDPAGLIKAMVSSDVTDPDQIRARQAAWAVSIAVPVLSVGAFVFGLVLYWLLVGPAPAPALADASKPDYDITEVAPDTPKPEPEKTKNPGKPGKPGQGGGGGGGKNEPLPVAKGALPKTQMNPNVPVADLTTKPLPPPPPNPMVLNNSVIAPPVERKDDLARLGDPNGKDGPPSDGPGQGGNYGKGQGGGVLGGDGRGEGNGKNWGRNGGDGGDGNGGGNGGGNNVAATKARILNSPRPSYTETARQNKTQGTVAVRALLGGDGRVKSASVVRGLPDGLNEKAIEAVYRLSFTPARNGAGQPIDSWVTVTVNFTIR